MSPREKPRSAHGSDVKQETGRLRRLEFPLNFVTAPLIADLFLLAILAIGREEVHDGTVGANNISPIDIMVFFLTLAYIAISIDASGLIRFLAFKVLQWGGDAGHSLFFYLYAFFFALGSFIGNDPIILSGTAFLAYMTRVSSNIIHPRAWIHTQFAVANIASAILVSSNPTNLVLAGAFNIKFIHYTANMIVPVVITAIILFPFLLYIVFLDPALIPDKINIHDMPQSARDKKPVNPNIPHARGEAEDEVDDPPNGDQRKLLPLEEIMNPFLDKGGAAFGAVIMAATLITLLAVNASSTSSGEYYVYWVTLPAAFVMFCWDVAFGWFHRHETRDIARKGREAIERARAEREEASRTGENGLMSGDVQGRELTQLPSHDTLQVRAARDGDGGESEATSDEEDQVSVSPPVDSDPAAPRAPSVHPSERHQPPISRGSVLGEKEGLARSGADSPPPQEILPSTSSEDIDDKKQVSDPEVRAPPGDGQFNKKPRRTLVMLVDDAYRWCQESLPTSTAVLAHLPYALVPFAFSMFVLVQALVTKGWVQVFAFGWDHWVNKTGTVGSIGGMAFLSVILCNVSYIPLSFFSSLFFFYEQHVVSVLPAPRTELKSYICLVRRNQHWHHNSLVARHSSVGKDPRPTWRAPHIGPDLLGNSLQHGPGGELRRFQHGFQRVARRAALARYSRKEAHTCAQA